jgi:hypothetical protein
MWPFAEEINDWFDQLKADKEETAGDDRTKVPLMKNEDPRLMRLKNLKAGK